jgi:DNA-binding CsgD family transcriptional regulator
VSAIRAAASFLNLDGILPQATPDQVRRNLRIGIVLRWIVIAVVAAGVMLTPQIANLLLLFMVIVAVYVGAIMALVTRAPAAWHPRIALAVTIVDNLICFAFLAVYTSHVAHSQPLGGYVIGIVEAIVFFGAAGAVLSLSIFVVSALTVQMLGLHPFGPTLEDWLVNAMLMLAVIAVCLLVAFRVRLGVGQPESAAEPRIIAAALALDGDGAVRLSRREREVLGLVAEGYSNTMIASRLRLSDSTVKGYVENLLFRLNARNRAEAVAAASRLKLL